MPMIIQGPMAMTFSKFHHWGNHLDHNDYDDCDGYGDDNDDHDDDQDDDNNDYIHDKMGSDDEDDNDEWSVGCSLFPLPVTQLWLDKEERCNINHTMPCSGSRHWQISWNILFLLKHQHYQLIIFVAALAASDQHCLSRGGKDLRLAKLVLHCFQKLATIAKGFSTTTSVSPLSPRLKICSTGNNQNVLEWGGRPKKEFRKFINIFVLYVDNNWSNQTSHS